MCGSVCEIVSVCLCECVIEFDRVCVPVCVQDSVCVCVSVCLTVCSSRFQCFNTRGSGVCVCVELL